MFFKWLKHNLRIKHFFGTSDNALKTQVWIAVCVYVLVAIVRKKPCFRDESYESTMPLKLSLPGCLKENMDTFRLGQVPEYMI